MPLCLTFRPDSVETHFLLGKKRLTLLLWPSGICRGIFEVAAFPSPVHRSPLGCVDITTTPTTVSAAAALVYFFFEAAASSTWEGEGEGTSEERLSHTHAEMVHRL